jgi:molybdopterin/thiamine biosynthesis adenylyltransferase
MEERYLRNLGALTERECALLRTKKVFVAGCGGLGGHSIDMLLRLGVGELTVADGDVFEPSNLNRQLLSDVNVIGHSKAETAAIRARAVNPQVRFTAVAEYVSPVNVAALLRGCDAVIDALDNIPSRKLLSEACARAAIPYVYGAIQGWVAQAAVILPGCGLMDTLYPQGAELGSKSSLACTPALCAALQTALCVKLLCGRQVEAGRLYLFDLLNMELETVF